MAIARTTITQLQRLCDWAQEELIAGGETGRAGILAGQPPLTDKRIDAIQAVADSVEADVRAIVEASHGSEWQAGSAAARARLLARQDPPDWAEILTGIDPDRHRALRFAKSMHRMGCYAAAIAQGG